MSLSLTPRYPLIPTALAIAMTAGGAHAFEPSPWPAWRDARFTSGRRKP